MNTKFKFENDTEVYNMIYDFLNPDDFLFGWDPEKQDLEGYCLREIIPIFKKKFPNSNSGDEKKIAERMANYLRKILQGKEI